MNDSRLVELDRILNDARMAAEDVAATLDNLACLYAEAAVHKSDGGADEKRLAGTFSTIQAQAARVLHLIEEGIG